MDTYLENFLPHLRCPISKTALRPVLPEQLSKFNERIAQQDLFHTDGSAVPEPLHEALISEDEQYVYPIVDGRIAVLLESLGIVTNTQNASVQRLDAEKKIVMDFYDEFGWKKNEDDLFEDTAAFEDRRTIAADYWSRCHLRVNRYLPNGQYILDVASGAIPNDEFFTYSDHFQVRICMDFSLLAMQQAVRRMNGQGVFILGDMTNMPLVDACLDAIVSLNTVYHIPRAEQTQAVAESYRLLKPGGKAVIIYSWKDAPLMYWTMRGWRALLRLVKRRKQIASGSPAAPSRPELFMHQQTYRWYARELRRPFHAQLRVYSALTRSFSNTFIREKTMGRQLSKLIYQLENLFPRFFGRYGQYPIFVVNKPGSGQKHP